ncbi:MAG: SpoIID/LytB domain-containing protein [Actinomycetota bacterium]
MKIFRLLFIACIAASVFVAVKPISSRAASGFPADTELTVDGHGWGHGFGMGQYGAIGYAKQGKTWTQILSTYYPGTTLSDRSAETIRVYLRQTSSAVVTSTSQPFSVYWLGGSNKVAQSSTQYPFLRASVSGSQITISRGASENGPWTNVASSSQEAVFHPGNDPLGLVSSSASSIRYYRGLIEVRLPQSASQAIVMNELGMEPYLDGVVPREMSGDWPADAVRAQAVAARSYAAARKDAARRAGKLYDICATDSCQVYGGYAKASSPSETPTVIEEQGSNDAVQYTQGKVLTYNGSVIEAEYSSSTGGYTSPGSVGWEKAVFDAGDSFSPFHNWTTTVTAGDIESAWPSIGALTNVQVTRRNGYGDWGGRVVDMTLDGTSGSVSISGDDFRSALGLRSNWFFVHLPSTWVELDGNLLTNGSFENGWSQWTQAGSHASSDGPTSSAVKDGSHAMTLVAGGSKSIVQELSLAGGAGRRFVLSGWARTVGTDPNGGAIALSLSLQNLDGTTSTTSLPWSRGAHDWQYVERSITASKPFSHATVSASFDNQTGSVFFDALGLTDTLLSNPSFEQGTSGWHGSGTTSADGPTSNVFKDGSHSMNFSGGTKSLAQRVSESGPAGRRYELGVWTKGDNNNTRGATELVAIFNNTDGSRSITTLRATSGSHSWQYLEGQAIATKPYSSIDVVIAVSNQTGTTFFDEVKLVQNRISNGSFEHGLSSWTVVGSGSPVGATTSSNRDGASSVRIGGGSGDHGVYVKLSSSGPASTPIFVGGWNRTTSASSSHSVRISVGFDNTDGSTTWRILYFPNSAHDWIREEIAATPDKRYSSIEIYAEATSPSADVFFDGLTLSA